MECLWSLVMCESVRNKCLVFSGTAGRRGNLFADDRGDSACWPQTGRVRRLGKQRTEMQERNRERWVTRALHGQCRWAGLVNRSRLQQQAPRQCEGLLAVIMKHSDGQSARQTDDITQTHTHTDTHVHTNAPRSLFAVFVNNAPQHCSLTYLHTRLYCK